MPMRNTCRPAPHVDGYILPMSTELCLNWKSVPSSQSSVSSSRAKCSRTIPPPSADHCRGLRVFVNAPRRSRWLSLVCQHHAPVPQGSTRLAWNDQFLPSSHGGGRPVNVQAKREHRSRDRPDVPTVSALSTPRRDLMQ